MLSNPWATEDSTTGLNLRLKQYQTPIVIVLIETKIITNSTNTTPMAAISSGANGDPLLVEDGPTVVDIVDMTCVVVDSGIDTVESSMEKLLDIGELDNGFDDSVVVLVTTMESLIHWDIDPWQYEGLLPNSILFNIVSNWVSEPSTNNKNNNDTTVKICYKWPSTHHEQCIYQYDSSWTNQNSIQSGD